MAKHKRLKPIREYLFDKGEMIEQMFSSIPIVEVRNMVPMKLQGMPLHELKAECLVELLEMSDREIMNVLEGKKTREPSSSESEGGVVVISDDEKRIKKERRGDWRSTLKIEDSDGSSTERSSSCKKKNKRKSKEKDDPKSRKKMKVESRQPAPSSSKDVLTSKEIPRKKKGAKLPEKPKPPAEDVVVLDDISSEEDGNGGYAKEGGKKTGEKSLLDLLELEMRARAIRSLLKKEEETQAQRILSEYKDEPDDLIPVEIAPPQVDLLSDSDEESKLEEPTAQPCTSRCLQLEVEGDALSPNDVGVLDSLLGIEKEESSDVVEVEDVSIDSTLVNTPVEPTVTNTIIQLETSKSDAVIVEDTVSLASKDSGMDCEVSVKVEKDNDEPNQPRTIEHRTVKSTPSSAQHSCLNQTQNATVAKSSTKSKAVEIHAPQKSVTTQAEISKLKGSKEQCPLPGKGKSNLLVPGNKSSNQPDDDFENTHLVIKEEPRSSEDDIVIAASKVGFEENDENRSSKTPLNIELILEGVDTKEASDSLQEVSSVKSGGAPLPPDLSDSPVESSKPQSISAGYDYHSNFEEDILDYDYDPSLNAERQSWNSVATGTSCHRSSPSSGIQRNRNEEADHEDGIVKNDSGTDINPKKVEKIVSLEAEIVKPSSINEKLISDIANRGCNLSSPKDKLNTSTSGGNPVTAEENISKHLDDVSSVKMPITFENEEVPLSFSDDEDSDSIQPAELEILSQDKCGITLSANKELHILQQCPSDSVCNTLKEINFLANDALRSPEIRSQKSTPKSQEHNEILKSPDLAEDQVSKHGRQQVDGSINTTKYASHKSEELADNSMSNDGWGSSEVDTMMQTPDANEETLDVANHKDSNSVLMVSDEVKNDDATLDAKGRTNSQDQCVGDHISNESEKHDHFLTNDALDSLEAMSPHLTIESQEHNETDLSISSQMDRESTTLDQDHHNKTPYSSHSQFLEIITGREEIVEENAHLCSSEGIPSQTKQCEDVLVESELCDFSDEDTRPSPKKAILAEELCGSILNTQKHSVDEVGSVECKIDEGLSDSKEHHFLVDAALDSLDPEGSETKPVNQEPNEFSLGVKDDVSQKRASPVSNRSERPHTEGTRRSSRTSGITEISPGNDEHFLGVPLESGSAIANQGLLCSKVDNGKRVQGEKDDSVPVNRNQEGTPHEWNGIVESDLVDQEGQIINVESRGQYELSLGGTNVRCCSKSETTAFVGCNSIEIQKKIQITNGQAVRQTVLLCGTSRESLNMDCIVVSSEEEAELNEVYSNQQHLDESISCSSKNIPCTVNPFSPTSDDSKISSHCGLQSHSIHQYSLGNMSGVSSCDILISSDEHTFLGTKSMFMEKIISNEGDPCPKSSPCSRTMESNCEPTEPSLTVVEQRGNHKEQDEIDKEGAVGDEKQTPLEAHGLEKTTSSHGARFRSSVISPKTKPFSLELVESYLDEEATTPNEVRIGTYGYSKAVKSNKPPSCKINYDKPTLHGTESLEVISSHHESPYILPALSSTSKASSLNPMQSSAVLEVRADKLGAEKKGSEVIEINYEDSSGSYSEVPQTTHERLVETQSNQEYSCVSLLVQVPAIKALLLESSQLSLLKKEEVSGASRDVDHTTVETTSHYGTPCPSSVTSMVSSLETIQSLLIPKPSDQSGTGKNGNSEVIETFDADSAGSSSEKEQIPNVVMCLKDTAQQQGDFPFFGLPLTIKTSTLEQTQLFSSVSKSMDVLEEGNSNSEVDVKKEESSGVSKSEEKQAFSGPNHLEGTGPPHGTCFSSPVSSSTTKVSNLEPTESPLMLESQTNQSERGINHSEVIEIHDEDSADSSRDIEQITYETKCLEDLTPQQGDSCSTSALTTTIETSFLEYTQALSSKCMDVLEKENSNSEVVKNKESSVVRKGEERQTCDGSIHSEDNAALHEISLSSPVPPSSNKTSSLEPTQSPLVLGLQTNQSATGNNNSEVIEIEDEDSGEQEEQIPNEAKCLEDTTQQQGHSSPSSAPSSITKTTTLPRRPLSSQNMNKLEKDNGNSDVGINKKECSGVSRGEKRPIFDDSNHLEENASPHETSLSSPDPPFTTKTSSLEPTQSPMLLGLQMNQSAAGNNNSEVIEIDDEDSGGIRCSKKEQIIPYEPKCLEYTTQQGDSSPSYDPSYIIKILTLEPTQPFSSVSKSMDVLKKGNSNSEVDVTKEESSVVINGEEEQTFSGPNHLEGTASPHGTSLSSTVPSFITKTSSQSPLVLGLQTNQSATGNNNSEVIEIDDEDSGGFSGKEEHASNVTECLEETTPSQSATGTLGVEIGTHHIMNENTNCEVIDVDDEDSKDSSEEDEDSDTSSEDSQESNDTVHSISDDEVLNGSQLHQGSLDKVENETEYITVEQGVKSNEKSVVQNKVLPFSEGFPNAVRGEIVNDIIDISDSASEHLATHCDQELQSVLGKNDDPGNVVVRQSALVQKVDTNVTNDVSSNLNPEPGTGSPSKHIHSPRAIKNVHDSGTNKHQGNLAVDEPPCKEQAPPEKELEEGEIEGSDGALETLEDEAFRNLKVLKSLETCKARLRPHKKRPVTATTTDSDSSVDSIHRSRLKRRLKLRQKRKKMIPERNEIQRVQKNIDGSKDQENLLKKDPPKELIATTLRGNRQIKIDLSKQTKGSMITCDTIVIEDDEEIVDAITIQMPPEILELDDSDEAKTNWTARWLESSHVKKVVTTSKILTNARKKMKMKLKVKEVPEVEIAPSLVEAPKLIGSVEEYHRLVKEGVITPSSKDISLEKKGAAETTETSLNSTTIKNSVENVGRANLPKENERACDPGIPVDQPRGKPDALEKTADERKIVQSNTTVNVQLSDPLLPTNIQESQTAQAVLDVDSCGIAGSPDSVSVKDIVLSGNNITNLIDKPEIREVEGKKLISEIQESNPQPPITETNSVEDIGNKSSEPSILDPLSSSIKSFYELMNPNQVIGIDLYSKSLSDIPIPPVVSEKNVRECNTLMLNQPAKLPTCGSLSLAAESNDFGITSKSFIGPSNLTCDRIEENTFNTLVTNNLSAASGLGPQLSPGNELEEGEIEESDNGTLSTEKNPKNIWVINQSPKVQPPLTIPSIANVRNIRLDNRPLIQPSGSSSSPAFNTNSVNHIVPVIDLVHRYTHNCIAGNSTVGSVPSLLSSQIVGQSTGIVQCANMVTSSNLVHPNYSGSTTSHSTLSSVVPPSYTVPEGQATPSVTNSAIQIPMFSGVHAASLPINPIQAASAEISNQYPYGVPANCSAHPQMSVNVNSTLHMYDPYYSWVYRQGLSGSLNSSYGYGAPEQSQDAGTIYKQWGEYYKKLMEACQDSADRASVSNMFVPPNVVESKGYSWVFERPNQAPAITDNLETATTVPKDVEPVPSQVPTGEWNYRYGLKGLLNEHFVTPGAAPASTATPNTPQGVPQSGPRGRRGAGRGRRRRKKK